MHRYGGGVKVVDIVKRIMDAGDVVSCIAAPWKGIGRPRRSGCSTTWSAKASEGDAAGRSDRKPNADSPALSLVERLLGNEGERSFAGETAWRYVRAWAAGHFLDIDFDAPEPEPEPSEPELGAPETAES